MKKKILILVVLFLFVVLVGCEDEIQDKQYTIKFDSNTSIVYPDIIIDKEGTISLPTPTKKGYTFKGWFPSEDYYTGTEVTEETVIGKNITLHAKWQPLRVKVTYDLKGGNLGDKANSYEHIYTDQSLTLPRAYKDNHIFVGWYIGDTQIDNQYEYLEDTTLTAKYISLDDLNPTYTVTLNFNDGTYYNYYDNPNLNYKYISFTSWNFKWEFIGVVTDFINDFGMFINLSSTDKNFYELSESKLIGNNAFLGEEKNFNKWLWLFEYLVTVANPENRQAIRDLIDGKYDDEAAKYGEEQIRIRVELQGFFKGNTFTTTSKNGIKFTSADYSSDVIRYGFEKSLVPVYEAENSNIGTLEYITGEGLVLLSPKSNLYTFEGWYTTPDFKGERVYEIMHNDHENIVLYAKWS